MLGQLSAFGNSSVGRACGFIFGAHVRRTSGYRVCDLPPLHGRREEAPVPHRLVDRIVAGDELHKARSISAFQVFGHHPEVGAYFCRI